MSTQVGQGTCPVCGSAVNVMGDHEGTMHYQLVGQFTSEELSLIAHLASATLSLFDGLAISTQTREQLEALNLKALQLAFMEISRDA